MIQKEIFQGVAACVARVVDCDPAIVKPGDRIIGDLGADSLDLLDLVFQLEQQFKIRIQPRDLERRAQAALGETPLEVDGIYTPAALAQLRRMLPEVPESELGEGLSTARLPYSFRVQTFVNLVARLRETCDGNDY